MKIGIFDSGLGGLSVLKTARDMLPGADFIYYADEKNVPYGEKTEEEVYIFVKNIFNFLIEKNVQAIIIACNTATTRANKEFREQFNIPIVGMEPAVKRAIDLYADENKKILVAATPITINGEKLRKLVDRVDTVHESDLIALPQLVRFAEQCEFNSDAVKTYIKEELGDRDLSLYGTIVPGCTHFLYYKDAFDEVFGRKMHFIDGNEGTVKQMIRLSKARYGEDLINELSDKEGSVEYYFSGEHGTTEQLSRVSRCLKQLEGE